MGVMINYERIVVRARDEVSKRIISLCEAGPLDASDTRKLESAMAQARILDDILATFEKELTAELTRMAEERGERYGC